MIYAARAHKLQMRSGQDALDNEDQTPSRKRPACPGKGLSASSQEACRARRSSSLLEQQGLIANLNSLLLAD